MSTTDGVLTLSQNQARELAGKRWVLNGANYRFADRDPDAPGDPPWRSGAEGIAYPLLGVDGQARAYAKFFDGQKITQKRIDRTKWLIEQRMDGWVPELRGAASSWVDTKVVGAPAEIGFDFTCSCARSVPGKTWAEVKADVVDGVVRLDPEVRLRSVENVIRALTVLEKAGVAHGDLSPGNVILNVDASPGEPTLYLIDFDGFFAPAAGRLARLSAGEGGTFGTEEYCPPELQRRAEQDILSAAPYSDRYGRDVLLIELLCFDADCGSEDAGSRWSREKICKGLSESGIGDRVQHLALEDVFQRPEERRPTSQDLARALNITTPPRVKVRKPRRRAIWSAGLGRRLLPSSWTTSLRTVVLVLWMVCVIHWGLISFWGAAWLWGLATTGESNGLATWLLSRAAQGLLGVGVFIAGTFGLSVWALAEDRPRLVNFLGLWFRIPPRRNLIRPYGEHLAFVAGQLGAILATLALISMLLAR